MLKYNLQIIEIFIEYKYAISVIIACTNAQIVTSIVKNYIVTTPVLMLHISITHQQVNSCTSLMS